VKIIDKYDIGCGVIGRKFESPNDINFEEFDKYLRENVPSGFSTREKSIKLPYEFQEDMDKVLNKLKMDNSRAYKSIGTLGGGNHFIEIGKSELDGHYWLFIHSGSRNFGLQVAKYHQLIAKQNSKGIPADLAYLQGKYMQDYLMDMFVAQRYATLNRETMLKTLWDYFWKKECKTLHEVESIHNFIDPMDCMLRKGAISAHKDYDVIIPFNMRDGIIIGRGKGNPDWNYSAPHGAGRILSRGKAKEQLNVDDFKEDMKGVWTSCVSKDTLDESPRVYKNKEDIIKFIEPTVEITEFVKPVYNFKASGD
jgi:RNA-splicing ligase RtcB